MLDVLWEKAAAAVVNKYPGEERLRLGEVLKFLVLHLKSFRWTGGDVFRWTGPLDGRVLEMDGSLRWTGPVDGRVVMPDVLWERTGEAVVNKYPGEERLRLGKVT